MILIIVESPTKARAISRYAREFFQRKDVMVRSSLGHLRDLPDSRLGVEVKNGFAPEYEILREKQKTIRALRPIIRQSEHVIPGSRSGSRRGSGRLARDENLC